MRLGCHFPNTDISDQEFEEFVSIPWSDVVLLHYQASYLPRLRESLPNARLVVRYYDKGVLGKNPLDYARSILTEALKWCDYTVDWIPANELNLTDEAGENNSPERVAQWCAEVATELRRLAPGIVIHAPAFSPIGNWWLYYTALMEYQNVFHIIDCHVYESAQTMESVVLSICSQTPKDVFISEVNGSGTIDLFNWIQDRPQILGAAYFIWHWQNPTPGWDRDLRNSTLEDQFRKLSREEENPMSKPTTIIGNLEVTDLRGELPDESGKMAPVDFQEKDFISIHHTATPTNTTAKAMYDYHRSLGWGGIGYNFLINMQGHIDYVGECNTERAAVGQIRQGNRRGIHIAMVIDLTNTTPSKAMLAAIKTLCANIQHAYGWFIPIVPHCLFNTNGIWDTSCPPGWRDWWSSIIRSVGE